MTNNSSKPSIPEWQRNSTPASSPPQDEAKNNTSASNSDSVPTPDQDRSALLEQAKTFLSDPTIRDATTTRKITFLESKGLTSDEINSLLGVSRNEDASSSSAASEPADTTSKTNNIAQAQTSTSSAAATSTAPPSRDVAPIITYPEFLVNASAQHKPPLLSLRGVLYTLYGAAGLGATLYGASEFLVKPMLNTLSDARHELAETTLTNLSTLNEKLEKNVSKLPEHFPISSTRPLEDQAEGEETDETESITSDPTEVFHRDIATQTSPDLLSDNNNYNNIHNNITTISDNENGETHHKAIESHIRSLEQITRHLQDFNTSQTTSSETDSSMRDRITDLQNYLDGLSYSAYNSYLSNSNMYSSSIYSNSGDANQKNSSSGSSSTRNKEEDAISTFRTEIRGVKGALLSARNFPSGRPAGVTR